MKMRVADYIASLLTQHGITDVFSVVGGGAMHLNDAFGNCEGLHVTYTHHEQAAAIAAEGYARAKGFLLRYVLPQALEEQMQSPECCVHGRITSRCLSFPVKCVMKQQ